MSMSSETPSAETITKDALFNEALVRDWFERVWNQQEVAAIGEYLTDDTLVHGMGPNGSDLVGIQAFEQVHAQFCNAFPDIHITVDHVVSQGSKAAVYLTVTATHTGTGLGVAPTGASVVFHAMTLSRIENGKIVEGWNVIDLLSVFTQAGIAAVTTALP